MAHPRPPCHQRVQSSALSLVPPPPREKARQRRRRLRTRRAWGDLPSSPPPPPPPPPPRIRMAWRRRRRRVRRRVWWRRGLVPPWIEGMGRGLQHLCIALAHCLQDNCYCDLVVRFTNPLADDATMYMLMEKLLGQELLQQAHCQQQI